MKTPIAVCVALIAGYTLRVNASVSDLKSNVTVDGNVNGKVDMASRLQRLEKHLLDQEAGLKDLHYRLTNCELGKFPPHTLRAKRAVGFVGFTAYLDHIVDHLGIDQTIVYDKTVLNEGHAYNPITGHFTVPIDGYYVFSYHIDVGNPNETGARQINARLSVDGINEVDGIADTMHQYHDAQGGNFVVLHLRVGQVVSMQNYRWPDQSIDGWKNDRLSTFSGYLIQ